MKSQYILRDLKMSQKKLKVFSHPREIAKCFNLLLLLRGKYHIEVTRWAKTEAPSLVYAWKLRY